MCKKGKKILQLFCIPAGMLLFCNTTLVACANFQDKFVLRNGSIYLQGIEGIASKDSKNWELKYNNQKIEANFSIKPLPGYPEFDENTIFIDKDGFVHWTNSILAMDYRFVVEAKTPNIQQVITSNEITLHINSSNRLLLTGGTTSLVGEDSFSYADTRKWNTFLKGELVPSTLSLEFVVQPTEFEITVDSTTKCVQWSNAKRGVYSFYVKAQYIDSQISKVYEAKSSLITLSILEKRKVNIFGGSNKIYAELNKKGFDLNLWKASLGECNDFSTFWRLESIDSTPIPSWISIDQYSGKVSWTKDVQAYRFIVKAQIIDNLTLYHYEGQSDAVEIITKKERTLTSSFNPDISKFRITTGIADSYGGGDGQFSLELVADGSTTKLPLDAPGLSIKIINEETEMETKSFKIDFKPNSYIGFLSWKDDLLASQPYDIHIEASYTEPLTLNHYEWKSKTFNLKVFYNFETDDWINTINISNCTTTATRIEACDQRYGKKPDDLIGTCKRLFWGKNVAPHLVRLIGFEADATKYDDEHETFYDFAAFTFEFSQVLCDETEPIKFQMTTEDNSKKTFNTWHFDEAGNIIQSDLCKSLNDKEKGNFIPLLPKEVRSNLKSVWKQSHFGQGYEPIDPTKPSPLPDYRLGWIKESVFLPSITELGLQINQNSYGIQPIEGKIYKYYEIAKKQELEEKARIKSDLFGLHHDYWTRTPYYRPVLSPGSVDPSSYDLIIDFVVSAVNAESHHNFDHNVVELPIAPCFCI